ncbi:hypothetical protein PM082_011287 [Marasmius tenuissimus]|nr:hypothetical protein PM082_011287 [Marasmius tenuissimus]
MLAKILGGTRLLYALMKAEGYPSDSTLRRLREIPKLLPSIRIPSAEEVEYNVGRFFHPEIRPSPPQLEGSSDEIPGNVFMFDGIALECRCRYCPRRNVVMGLCREHVGDFNLEVTDINSLDTIKQAIHEHQTVCIGSDATVVAVAPYARSDHYTPVPIIISPSDKTETAEDLVEWVQTVLDTWEKTEYGGKRHGKIWAIATDGDSVYRLAKHILCMTTQVEKDSPLGQKVHALPGLNCFTSKYGVISTCDPKHIFKRFATLLRNAQGVIVIDHIFYPHDILNNLERLPGMSKDRAKELLDPVDKQNVPKATQLSALLQQIEKIDTDVALDSPSTMDTRHGITFFAKVLGYFVSPFVNTTYSLSEQVRSLSTFAHLSFALQLKHGSSCFTGALYSDTQSVIKNIVFTIARLQLINPDHKFFIILEGTDRLEGQFSDVRTQDHARNCDIEQLAQKLSASTLLQAIYERNPELDRGHRRLSFKGALGVDHINPRSWEGDVRVGLVNLIKEWCAGADEANEVLARWWGDSQRVDFSGYFSRGDVDLLRPKGGNNYVGVRVDLENSWRSESDDNDPTGPAEGSHPSETNLGDSPASNTNAGHFRFSTTPNDTLNQESLPEHQEDDEPFDPDDDDRDDEPLGVDVDDYFPAFINDDDRTLGSQPDPPPTMPETIPNFILYDGKKYLKASLVAMLSSNRAKRVSIRTLRVRGVTLEDVMGKRSSIGDEDDDLDGNDLLKAGDLACSVVLHDGKGEFALVVLKILGFRAGKGKMTTSIRVDSLNNGSESPTVIAQVLDLPPSTHDYWEWSNGFIMLHNQSSAELTTRSRVALSFPGHLVYPLVAMISRPEETPSQLMWKVRRSDLVEILDCAKEELGDEHDDLAKKDSILLRTTTDKLPYRNPTSTRTSLLSFPIKLSPLRSNVPRALPRDAKRSCKICNNVVPIEDMREHVGAHILAVFRGGDTELGRSDAIGVDPCGFCGTEGCFTRLSITTKKKTGQRSFKVESNCSYRLSTLDYDKARASSCTNLPLHCPLCPPSVSGHPVTIWKYNAIFHLVLNHPADKGAGTVPVPCSFLVESFISKKEEGDMKMALELTESFRSSFAVDNSSDIEQMEVEIKEGNTGRKRTLTLTQDVADRLGKRRNTDILPDDE